MIGASLMGGDATRVCGDLRPLRVVVVFTLMTDGGGKGTAVMSGPLGPPVLRLEAWLEPLALSGDLGRPNPPGAPCRPFIEDGGYLLLTTLGATRDLSEGACIETGGDPPRTDGSCNEGEAPLDGACKDGEAPRYDGA